MVAQEATLTFPVLGFSRDNDVWGFWDQDGLTICGRKTLQENLQDEMELVDANGLRWRVERIHLVKPLESPLKRLFTWFLYSPGFRIRHDLTPLAPLSLKETQERVCAAMEAFPLYWCEEDEIETVLKGRLAEVRATPSIAAIHDVLGLDNFRSY